jgi:hypothetical protein
MTATKKTTKKEKIAALEAKRAALWAEYEATTDFDQKMSLLRIETGLAREIQYLQPRGR